MKIVLCGWNHGFNKIALTKLFRAECSLTLERAKAITDAVLEGQSASIEVSDSEAERMISDLTLIGVKWTR
jgi:ribosomal protein L7/L12